MDTLTSLRVFATVAELKSFTAAAERFRLSPAMASKHVQALEARLGTRLLNRTSRRVSLTDVGALYLEQARQAVGQLDEVEAAIGNTVLVPRGLLRLSAPVWMANAAFAEALAGYQRRYPEVALDVDLGGRLVNLVEEGFDLALRATHAPDPGLVARRLALVDFRLVAAPAYLGRTGVPRTLARLAGRELLAYTTVPPDGRMAWQSPVGARAAQFRPVLRSGNETLLLGAARAGMELVFLPGPLVAADLASGALVPVLGEEATMPVPLYAVYPSRRYLAAKVRAFIDHLAACPELVGP